jgi:hypothetical protein
MKKLSWMSIVGSSLCVEFLLRVSSLPVFIVYGHEVEIADHEMILAFGEG